MKEKTLSHLSKFINKFLFMAFLFAMPFAALSEEKNINFIETNWSFKGIFGTFDRASLQRGYQVYQEVCSGCHSVQHLSYRNLSENGGPEFTIEEAKAIASQFEVEDGPNSDGEIFMRSARPSDKFVSPYPNVEASTAANGSSLPAARLARVFCNHSHINFEKPNRIRQVLFLFVLKTLYICSL
jgi:ubiquinol-cytochrome c reductase cytochrome c1 subunit